MASCNICSPLFSTSQQLLRSYLISDIISYKDDPNFLLNFFFYSWLNKKKLTNCCLIAYFWLQFLLVYFLNSKLVNECVSNCPWQLRESQTGAISLGKSCCRGSRITRQAMTHTHTPFLFVCEYAIGAYLESAATKATVKSYCFISEWGFLSLTAGGGTAGQLWLLPHHHHTATRDDAFF